jgi:rubrerythrin
MDQETRNILGLCKDIEEIAAGIYFHYAEIFADLTDIRILWEKTAYEEKNHANLIKMVLNCRDLKLTVHQKDLFRCRCFANMMRSIHENLRQVRPSLEDSLRSSINMEKKLSEFHLEFVASFENISEGKFFLDLAKADIDHVSALEEAYRALLEKKNQESPVFGAVVQPCRISAANRVKNLTEVFVPLAVVSSEHENRGVISSHRADGR